VNKDWQAYAKHIRDKEIQVDLILKNRDNSTKVYKANIDKIDNHVPEKYTIEQVGKIVEMAVI
jgi:hypothetical protein